MDVELTHAQVAEAFQRDWPREAEITMLRLVNRRLGEQLAAAQREVPDASTSGP